MLDKVKKTFGDNGIYTLATLGYIIIMSIVFDVLSINNGYFSIFKNLASTLRFYYIFLILLSLFKAAIRLSVKKDAERRKILTDFKIKDESLEKSQKDEAVEKSQKESAEIEVEAYSGTSPLPSAEHNKSTSGKKVKVIKENLKAVKEKRPTEYSAVKITKIVFLFIFALFFIVYISIRASFYEFLTEPKITQTTFVHIIIILMFMIITFVLRRIFKYKDADTDKRTAISVLLVLEFLLTVSLVFLLLKFIFTINYLFVLSWVYWFVLIISFVSIAFGMVNKLIRKEFLRNTEYSVVPYKNSKEEFFDSIEKNTGLNFKSRWSIKYFISLAPILILSILGALFLSTGVYKVEPYQKAVVYRFGVLQEEIIEPGLHFKIPFPVDKVEIMDVDRVQNIQIGYEVNDTGDNLWTEEHNGGEYKLLLGNGNELVAVNVKLTYKISDLYKYVKYNSMPDDILSARAYEVLMENTISSNLDTVLSVDRSELANTVKTKLNSYSENMNLGLAVGDVIIESIHPPVEVADIYQSVISAGIEKKTAVIEAENKAAQELINAEKQKNTDITDANMDNTDRVSSAKLEMAVYYAAFEAYSENPESFKLSKYLKTYEKVIKGSKIYVFSPNIDGDLSDYIIGADGQLIKKAAEK